ncbi:hypothetical protein AF960_00819 [Listeria monocytogenes]|nr:hypothetical protein AF960_00819 [Listeria monocytogenes]
MKTKNLILLYFARKLDLIMDCFFVFFEKAVPFYNLCNQYFFLSFIN